MEGRILSLVGSARSFQQVRCQKISGLFPSNVQCFCATYLTAILNWILHFMNALKALFPAKRALYHATIVALR